jgi:CTP:molybdopterin cytidylyltransferase MocA
MTCDMPAVSPDHLRLLTRSGSLTGSYYGGRTGVPAFFPSELFPELLRLTGDSGAKSLLDAAQRVPLAGGELDVDTLDDLALAQRLRL